MPIFAAVGLLFPAAATLITFAANRRLGPVITGSLGNLAPVFAVLLAFVLLGEPLRLGQMLGLAIILAGVLVLTGLRGTPERRLGVVVFGAAAHHGAALRGLHSAR